MPALPACDSAEAIPRDLRQRLEIAYQTQSLRTFASGQSIPLGSETIWLVYRGVVLLNTDYDNGDESLLGLVTPYQPFGRPLSQVSPYQAIALTPVDVFGMPWQDVERSSDLAWDLLNGMNRRLQQSERLLALMGQRRVEDRLRQFLQMLQEDLSQPLPQGDRLRIRLTHQHLANALGTTRVTITRILGQLRRENWLAFDDDRHIIMLQQP